jgi:hypothetical protein
MVFFRPGLHKLKLINYLCHRLTDMEKRPGKPEIQVLLPALQDYDCKNGISSLT